MEIAGARGALFFFVLLAIPLSVVREIEEMKQLIADLDQNPVAADIPDLPPRTAKGALPPN